MMPLNLQKLFRKQPKTVRDPNALPRLMQEGIRKLVSYAIFQAQDELIEKQVGEYRERLKELVRQRCEQDISVAVLGMFSDKSHAPTINVIVNMGKKRDAYEQ